MSGHVKQVHGHSLFLAIQAHMKVRIRGANGHQHNGEEPEK